MFLGMLLQCVTFFLEKVNALRLWNIEDILTIFKKITALIISLNTAQLINNINC